MIEIRQMTKKDIAAVCDIQLQSFGERTPDAFEKDILNPTLFYGVAVMSGSVVGYFGCAFAGDSVDILTIAVDRLWRRHGIGTQLLKFVIGLGKGKKIFLEIETNNEAAMQLYLKLGFRPENERKDYYGKNRNALVMSLDSV